jgi:hypothetical protein
MGLDAVVYRSRSGLPKEWAAAEIDARTGEPIAVAGHPDIPRKIRHAVHRRIGNIDAVCRLRDAVRKIRGRDGGIILDKVLFSGSHSGPVIELEYMDGLQSEIATLRAGLNDLSGLDADLTVQFIEDMEALVIASRAEQNPIVFV